MTNSIQDTLTNFLPAKRRLSPSGWLSMNSPCCVHNGETQDTRGRGGLIMNPDGGITWHCFNCQYKTSWQPGRHLSYKFRKLLSWFGIDENTIKMLIIDALRISDTVAPTEVKEEKEEYTIKPRALPEESVSFSEMRSFLALTDDNYKIDENFCLMIDYVVKRKINLDKYEFYWTTEKQNNLHKRVIIPFYWKQQLIGYTARAATDTISKPKYYSNYEPNFVFNTDKQHKDNKFVIVVEGPFDAMSIDGVAVLSNNISETQADIIDGLGKEVIVVPDFDIKEVNGKKVWSGEGLVDAALKYHWNVSFPIWTNRAKDVSEAHVKFGKLYTLKAILEAKESNRLKIELLRKRIYR